MSRALQVCWWDGGTIGHLVQKGSIYFAYDEGWLRRGLNLSPLSLPFNDLAFNGAKGIDGLPGLIADCLPDSWGRKVARTEFARNEWGEPDSLSLLAWRGRRGLGALQFVPPMEGERSALEEISAARLARGAGQIERGEPSSVLPQLARGGTAGGVCPKALVLAYEDGTLRVGEPDAVGQPCLLKFDKSERGDMARCEHAYARMAAAGGIRVVQTKLVEEAPGSERRHLLVSRFDVREKADERIHFHSASGLLHREPGELDYRDLYRTLIRLHADPEELEELTRRMLFNVLASNQDDHGKNHAFKLDEKTGRWSLTPAFDLTYSEEYLQRGTQIDGEVWPKLAVMEALCAAAGVTASTFQEAVASILEALHQWKTWAEEAGVSNARTSEIATRFERMQKAVIA